MLKKRFGRSSATRISFPVTKKGQVTIFIIIGIILLIVLGLVIAIQQELFTFKPGTLIPTQKGKIENFISACIQDAGEEALQLIGLQGGYITVPPQFASDSSVHLRLSPDFVVPYWAVGSFVTIPSLEEIKSRADRHIEENVRDCLLGTEAFQETYTITEIAAIKADTQFVEGKTIFEVAWDIEVRDKAGEVVSRLQSHLAESPIKFKRVYDTARQIMEEELSQLKLEDLTQDLIALEAPHVPVAGVELSCSRKEWNVGEVKEQLQDLLRINIKKLKVQGTEFVEYPDDFPYYQNHYVWDFGDTFQKEDVSVLFRYENNFPFLFQVTPSQGGKMRSGMVGGTDILSTFCVQTWKFTYDLSYPVLVEVRDETTDYDFNFAFTVHLLRNTPNREDALIARAPGLAEFNNDQKFCADRRILLSVTTWELVENQQEGVFSREPLDDVAVGFTCLNIECDIGTTDINFAQRGYRAGLTNNFPYCAGGILRGEKEGYKEDWERIVTKAGEETELHLVPLFEVPLSKIRVIKHELTSAGPGIGVPLSKNEMALIRFTHYKNNQEFHSTEAVVGGLVDDTLSKTATFNLLAKASFEYTLQVDVFDNEKLIGGYRQNITLSWEELQDAETISLHVLSKKGASDQELFELISTLETASAQLPPPELK